MRHLFAAILLLLPSIAAADEIGSANYAFK